MGVYVYLARSTVDGIRIGVSILLVMGGNGGRGNGVTRMIHQKKVLTLWGKLDKRTFQPSFAAFALVICDMPGPFCACVSVFSSPKPEQRCPHMAYGSGD